MIDLASVSARARCLLSPCFWMMNWYNEIASSALEPVDQREYTLHVELLYYCDRIAMGRRRQRRRPIERIPNAMRQETHTHTHHSRKNWRFKQKKCKCVPRTSNETRPSGVGGALTHLLSTCSAVSASNDKKQQCQRQWEQSEPCDDRRNSHSPSACSNASSWRRPCDILCGDSSIKWSISIVCSIREQRGA